MANRFLHGATAEDERAADAFTKETLIPTDVFNGFAFRRTFSDDTILGFARTMGIDPGIVVGRLRKEGYIDFSWYNICINSMNSH